MAGINGFGNNNGSTNPYALPYNYYTPNLTVPTPQPQSQTGFVWVYGEEGAKAYPVARGNTILMLDSNESLFYLKSMDLTGAVSLRKFKFEEIHELVEDTSNDTPPKAEAEVDMIEKLSNQIESLSTIVGDLTNRVVKFEDETVQQLSFMEDKFNRFRNDKKNKHNKESNKE